MSYTASGALRIRAAIATATVRTCEKEQRQEDDLASLDGVTPGQDEVGGAAPLIER